MVRALAPAFPFLYQGLAFSPADRRGKLFLGGVARQAIMDGAPFPEEAFGYTLDGAIVFDVNLPRVGVAQTAHGLLYFTPDGVNSVDTTGDEFAQLGVVLYRLVAERGRVAVTEDLLVQRLHAARADIPDLASQFLFVLVGGRCQPPFELLRVEIYFLVQPLPLFVAFAAQPADNQVVPIDAGLRHASVKSRESEQFLWFGTKILFHLGKIHTKVDGLFVTREVVQELRQVVMDNAMADSRAFRLVGVDVFPVVVKPGEVGGPFPEPPDNRARVVDPLDGQVSPLEPLGQGFLDEPLLEQAVAFEQFRHFATQRVLFFGERFLQGIARVAPRLFEGLVGVAESGQIRFRELERREPFIDEFLVELINDFLGLLVLFRALFVREKQPLFLNVPLCFGGRHKRKPQRFAHREQTDEF